MLEELKKQREEYAAEVNFIESEDLSLLIEDEFLKVKEEIAARVTAEHDKKLADAKLKVEHYDFVIANIEKFEKEQLENAPLQEDSLVNAVN